MNIDLINPNDINQLKQIHDKYFKDEFAFPDFLNGYLSSFVVTDDNDNIITAGGVRLIAESVIITNKDYDIRDRREALLTMLKYQVITCGKNKFNQLHAFVQDDKWYEHLKRIGFKDSVGKAIVLSLE